MCEAAKPFLAFTLEGSLTALAKLTPGFAGADIENMVNEAAILAARRNLRTIGRGEFADALERIIAGPERSKLLLNAHERKVVAYHEAGHAVAMYHLPCADPVHKVTIMSRGMALGFTMPLPEGEKVLRTREAFEDEIASLLAGRAAEEVVFKQVTTGAANDLERATAIAQQMVTRFGMSDRLGLRAFGQQQSNAYLGLSTTERDYGEEIARLIDEEVRRFIDEGYRRARQLLLDHYDRLEAVACALLERETLEREDFESLMQVQ
jgi:cell division protease FtsH